MQMVKAYTFDSKKAYHSLIYAVARQSGSFLSPSPSGTSVPLSNTYFLRPLVTTHLATQRKVLLSTIHCFGVQGMPRDESEKLLD